MTSTWRLIRNSHTTSVQRPVPTGRSSVSTMNPMSSSITQLRTTKPWDNIEHLFIDSGGYSRIINNDGYETTPKKYIQFIKEHERELYALRDFPVTEDNKNNTVKLQKKCIEEYEHMLKLHDEHNIESTPVPVIHGYTAEDYIGMVLMLKSKNIFEKTDYVGIGSLKQYDGQQVKDIIKKVKAYIPDNIKIHGFGIDINTFIDNDLYPLLDSADSQSYSMSGRYMDVHRSGDVSRFLAVSNSYTSQKIKLIKSLKSVIDNNPNQSVLSGFSNKNNIEKFPNIKNKHMTYIENVIENKLKAIKSELGEEFFEERGCQICSNLNRPPYWSQCPVFDCECPYPEMDPYEYRNKLPS